MIYGLRAHGAHCPQRGHRFNPNKLLLDPYAREIVGKFTWHAEHHGYTLGHSEGPASYDGRDNASQMLKARVPESHSDQKIKFSPPRHPARDVVLYEVHVKGFSQSNPAIPENLRGTYSALSHPVSIAHFKSLGVTTLSLLPVQYCVDEPALAARGSSNYWGYNTLGFFCPDPRWALQKNDPTAINEEFRQMVRILHSEGIEVVLDVVYNHTPEGNEWGPTLSMRGLDNASWYRLQPQDASRSEDFSGCGNTLNISHPQVTRFVLDSLRYWVEEMGVDGFRFDLAPVLGRTRHGGFDPNANFFAALLQDPILARVHLIAEPWDSGPEGYEVGRFPGRFAEWNDKFRDAMRAYWLQANVSRGEFARRFTASSDLFDYAQRLPSASINFLSVHDGFTLLDTLSYSKKNNQANGEDNRDGRDNELCANFGEEGETTSQEVLALRKRVRRSMMASLLLAQGTPMICAGDEIGKTQHGNNNAYCQDNEISWLDWQHADQEFQNFVSKVLALRRNEALLRFDEWFSHGHPQKDEPIIHWLRTDGTGMQLHDWHDTHHHAFTCHLLERQTDTASTEKQGLMALNPTSEAVNLVLPVGAWQILLDTSEELSLNSSFSDQLSLPAHSMLILHLRNQTLSK